MRIVRVTAAMRPAFDAFVAQHPLAGPFHATAWLRAVKHAYRFDHAALASVSDGQVTGVLPMVSMDRPGGGGQLVSLPYCDFAGPLAEDAKTGEALIEGALALARETCRRRVVIRQIAESPLDGGKLLMRLALPDSAQTLHNGFPSKLRSQIDKPTRDGLTVVSGGAECLEDFYAVFAQNMRDLGSPTHSRKWFAAVIREFGVACRVWLVRLPDGRPAATSITLSQGKLTCVPWASSLRRHNRSNANMLLYWSMLAAAAQEGQAVFDFGRSSPGGGTYRFKRQWGARETALHWVAYDPATGRFQTSRPAKDPFRLRRLAETGWRHLPLYAANRVGPILRRYISL